MTSKDLLVVSSLRKYFGGIKAIDDLTYKIKESEITAMIGPNGAGKTTFINLVAGFLKPDKGEIVFRGKNITHISAHNRVKLGIVRTFQLSSIFSKLSVYENLKLAIRDKHSRESKIRQLARAVGLEDQLNKTAGSLPLGNRKKLEIAMAIGLNPILLLLDEPFAGLSEKEIDELIVTIENLAKQMTIFLVEHKISKVLRFANRLTVLYEGKIIGDGDPKDVIDDPMVKKVYWKYEHVT